VKHQLSVDLRWAVSSKLSQFYKLWRNVGAGHEIGRSLLSPPRILTA